MPKSSPKASHNAFQQRQQLIAAAAGGDADAQSRVGDICREGDEYTTQDYGAALRWYRLAAEQGDPNAQNNFGAMHEHAMGVPENMDEAAKWYGLAAEQGLAAAQYNLALLLGWGIGVPMDEAQATDLLQRAARQGYIPACSLLGTLYRHGDSVPKWIALAAEYHVIAALEGDEDALAALADYRDEIEAEALNGSLLASLCIAKMFDRGLAVKEDKTTMLAWLTWGERCGYSARDADVREELIEMKSFYELVLADDVKARARALCNAMLARHIVGTPTPAVAAGA